MVADRQPRQCNLLVFPTDSNSLKFWNFSSFIQNNSEQEYCPADGSPEKRNQHDLYIKAAFLPHKQRESWTRSPVKGTVRSHNAVSSFQESAQDLLTRQCKWGEENYIHAFLMSFTLVSHWLDSNLTPAVWSVWDYLLKISNKVLPVNWHSIIWYQWWEKSTGCQLHSGYSFGLVWEAASPVPLRLAREGPFRQPTLLSEAVY